MNKSREKRAEKYGKTRKAQLLQRDKKRRIQIVFSHQATADLNPKNTVPTEKQWEADWR
jgi:hypothetical protein